MEVSSRPVLCWPHLGTTCEMLSFLWWMGLLHWVRTSSPGAASLQAQARAQRTLSFFLVR